MTNESGVNRRFIKLYLVENDMTLEELSVKLKKKGVKASKQYISMLIRGIGHPSYKLSKALGQMIKVKWERVLEGDKNNSPNDNIEEVELE